MSHAVVLEQSHRESRSLLGVELQGVIQYCTLGVELRGVHQYCTSGVELQEVMQYVRNEVAGSHTVCHVAWADKRRGCTVI